MGNSHGAKSPHTNRHNDRHDDGNDADDALPTAVEALAEQLDPVPPAVVDAAKAAFAARATDETADPVTLTTEGAGR